MKDMPEKNIGLVPERNAAPADSTPRQLPTHPDWHAKADKNIHAIHVQNKKTGSTITLRGNTDGSMSLHHDGQHIKTYSDKGLALKGTADYLHGAYSKPQGAVSGKFASKFGSTPKMDAMKSEVIQLESLMKAKKPKRVGLSSYKGLEVGPYEKEHSIFDTKSRAHIVFGKKKKLEDRLASMKEEDEAKEKLDKGVLDTAKKVVGTVKDAAKFVGHNTLEDAKTVGKMITDPKNIKQHAYNRLATYFKDKHAKIKQDSLAAHAAKLPKSEIQKEETKGVHKPMGAALGQSRAGFHAKDSKIEGEKEKAKESHKKVIAEQKAMPKPNLPKSEKFAADIKKCGDMFAAKKIKKEELDKFMFSPEQKRGLLAEGKKKTQAAHLKSKQGQQKGVHGGVDGESVAGSALRTGWHKETTKKAHSKVIAEQKAMPKPSLPKSEKDV